MAFTYGTVTNCKVRNGQTRKEYECRLGYEVQSQSIANNTSSVKLKLQCRSISSSYTTKGSSGLTSKIDGTTVKNNAAVDMSNTNTWQNFGERTITVTHNSNGTYSASKSGSFTCTAGSSNYSLRSGSASVTVAPATIPRYATSNQSLSGRTSYSIIMDWSSDSTIDYVWYSKDNGASWVAVGSVNATSGRYTIPSLSSNTTYNIKTRVRRKDSQLTTDSATLAVTTHYTTTASVWVSSRTENTITVASSSNVTASSTKYRIAQSGGSYGSWQTSATFSGLYSDTTYTIQVEKVGQASGEAGYNTVSTTTYRYPYCTSGTDFTIGGACTMNLYNPLGRNVTVIFVASDGNTVSNTTTGTSYSGINSSESIAKLYASIPSSSSAKYSVKVTYGSVTNTKSNAGTYSVKGIEIPTFSNFSYEDTNEKTKRLTGNNQILVSGYSNLKASISTANKAYSNYGTTIDKYRLNVGNMSSVEKAYSDTAQVDLLINKASSPSITVTAIDKRGYSKQVSKTASFKSYTRPVITSLSATRGDGGVGSQVTLSFNGTWWNDNFGTVQNTIKEVSYYYKKTTESSWVKGNITIIPTISGNNFSGNIKIEGPNYDKGFDITLAYNIKMIVTDELDISSEYQTMLGTGAPAIAIWENKVSIGQRYDENLGGALQVKGEAIEQGLRVSSSEPSLHEKVWIKNSNNLFKDSLMYSLGNCAYSNGIVTQTTADTNQNPNWKLQAFTKTWDYIRLLKTFQATFGRNILTFVKTSDFDNLQLGVNGTVVDTVIFIDVSSLKNDRTYSISFEVTNLTQGSISWKNIQIEQGSFATEYEPYVEKEIYCKNANGFYESFFNTETIGIETITNKNGKAIKFPDGTMICRAWVDIPANTSRQTIEFPAPFINADYSVNITNLYNNYTDIFWSVAGLGASQFNAYPYRIATGGASNYSCVILYIAIGRWK